MEARECARARLSQPTGERYGIRQQLLNLSVKSARIKTCIDNLSLLQVFIQYHLFNVHRMYIVYYLRK